MFAVLFREQLRQLKKELSSSDQNQRPGHSLANFEQLLRDFLQGSMDKKGFEQALRSAIEQELVESKDQSVPILMRVLSSKKKLSETIMNKRIVYLLSLSEHQALSVVQSVCSGMVLQPSQRLVDSYP